ncbi:protein mono-ADP-ribosyltransferase PARP14-like isoform X2 [Rhea pennata]|uniref:protein mono-ADP-ribosyltransferase PARP14-like isoform X2 n=1 Tax=Rhea pennata TaxID=8795 RepID=UPI002E270178
MAGQQPDAFPLLVRGDWGAAEPPGALRKKLLCYFQSQKRSGGGECELRAGPAPGHLLVCFARRDVRQQVLQRQIHELDLGGKKKLKLFVMEPETAAATEKEASQEEIVPTKENREYDAGEASWTAQSFVSSTELQEKSCSTENIAECSTGTSLLVALKNVQHFNAKCLCMLLENISGLTADDDFHVEMIPDINTAVATFVKSVDAEEFVKKCAENKQIKKSKITARLLEVTCSLKAENIPAGVSTDYITLYFESTRSGGGLVSDVQLLPEERSAIVTFCSPKDLSAVLEKQHSLEQTPISVHPYYHSLGTALYGEERPSVKMPEPIRVPLDPYIWQFLQKRDQLIQEINQEMAVFHCDVKWPQTGCTHPEITLCPSSSLSEQKMLMIQLIKTWKQDASAELSRIMSRYTAIKCQVNSADWEDVKARLVKDVALIVTDTSEEMVVIAGNRAAVDSAEKEVRECLEKAMKESERQKQSIEISVSIMPGKYAFLHNAGLEENIYKEYPCLKIFYDDTKKTIQLRGLPAEVYKIKADLLEKIVNMPYKSVNIVPHVFQYLQCVDSETMSGRLFTSKKIKAFYELEDGNVVLFGESPKDLLDAEKQINTALDCKCIDLEDSEVIKKEGWRSLVVFLCKKYNYSQKTVTIDEPDGKENKVIITGFSKAVAEVYQNVFDFIDRNTHMEKVIPAKSVAAVQFIEKEKANVYLEFRKKGVTVCFDIKAPCISLSGPTAEVPKAATTVEQILSSLCCKNVLIDKPGAKELFTERKDLYVLEAKQKYDCLIRLKQEQEQKDEKVDNEVERELHYKETLEGGVVIAVYKGNLCNYPVDVVVDVLSEDSKPLENPAGALLQVASQTLQRESEQLLKHRCLKAGGTFVTSAEKLPCKHVIHAVVPSWRKKETAKFLHWVTKTVKRCLQLAKAFNHRSIAFPSISAGIWGFSLQQCTHSAVFSIKKTLEKSVGNSSLKEVHLVDDEDRTIRVLSETVKQVFTTKSSSGTLLPQLSESCSLKESQKAKRKEALQMITTGEGLCIRLEQKNIQDATTDVIVNSVGVDLRLGVGCLCKALLEKAGPGLQLEFDKEKQGQVAGQGTVLHTGGYNLACKSVLHAILPVWDRGVGLALKTLEDIVNCCLQKTEALALNSIAFPPIGTGGFGFPKSTVAKLMFDTVLKFSSSHAPKTLREVHFLLHPNDTNNIQAFTSELEHRVAENCSATAPQQRVFKAIMDAAGSQVKGECAQYAGQLQHGFVTTQGGNLPCSKIIHLIHNLDVRKQVTQVLQECELQMYKSVAFPAIGTGQAGQSPAKVADNMLDAIIEFASKKAVQHLKKIRIIIFETKMNSNFYKSMKKKQESYAHDSDTDKFKLTSFLFDKKQSTEKKQPLALEKKVELVTFQICGQSQKNVDDAASWITKLILKEQSENTISDELIESFDQRQINTLADLQRRKHVSIQLENNLSAPQIKISGISRDVYSVSMEVQNMIQKLKDAREEQSKAELVYNLIEWRYPGSNDTFEAFDKLTNMQLEDARIAKSTYVMVKIKNKNYKVDLNTLQANDDQGTTISIQRVLKNEEKQAVELPAEWEDMKEEWVRVVNLPPGSQQYLDVQKEFQKTCPNFTIKKIERIQNPFLWQTYQIKKRSMDKKNKNQNNEKLLFHGTAGYLLSTINHNGFNRSFAGKNAAVIGKGTYFAVGADYSAQDIYSRPDVNGKKYMYLARVLTGEYCAGSADLVTPPAKNPADPTDLYDSVVNDINLPETFVIFSDIQAYPEYLITFRIS